MRIAMIGCKGIPAATSQGGGIETHVEELATRLVARGHDVTVYVRPYANPDRLKTWKGIRLVTLPTIRRKNLDAITSTLVASLYVLFRRVDIVHYHGVGPSTLAWIPRLLKPGTKIIVTFHSRDRFHEKWGVFARTYLAIGEWTAVAFPHATIATSHAIKLFCKRRYGADVWYIPNGVEIPPLHPGADALQKLGLEPGTYLYTLSRLVPHKAVEDAVAAFRTVETDMRLAIVGWAAKSEMAYQRKLEALAKKDTRVVILGRRVGRELAQIIANSYAMIHPSRSEGLSVAVLEAMSYGKLVVMSDIPENLELVDHSGIAYKVGDVGALRDTIRWVLSDPRLVEERGARARDVVLRLFSWGSVVDRTEALYSSLLKI